MLTSITQTYEKLRKHPDIRFEIKKIIKTCDKVNLLIQVNFQPRSKVFEKYVF